MMDEIVRYAKIEEDHFEFTAVGQDFAVGMWENRRGNKQKRKGD